MLRENWVAVNSWHVRVVDHVAVDAVIRNMCSYVYYKVVCLTMSATQIHGHAY